MSSTDLLSICTRMHRSHLSPRECGMLAWLCDPATVPGPSVKHVAHALGLDKPSITRGTKKMKKNKLLNIQRSEEDTRCVKLVPTAKGRKLIDELTA